MLDIRLSMNQTFAQIGIDRLPQHMEIQSKPGTLDINSEPAKLEVSGESSELAVDSSKAWMALGSGSHLEWLSFLDHQMQGEFLMNLARIVNEGNRMADLKNKEGAIPSIALERVNEKSTIQYVSEASNLNVDVSFVPSKKDIQWQYHQMDIRYTPSPAEILFTRGEVTVYSKIKQSLEITVGKYDIYR